MENTLHGVKLDLKLTAYDGFVRLYINEDAAKGRFQVRQTFAHLNLRCMTQAARGISSMPIAETPVLMHRFRSPC